MIGVLNLIRVFERREYAETFLDGILYMLPLSHYRGLEAIEEGKTESDGELRYDLFEGSSSNIRKGELAALGLAFDDRILAAMGENVALLDEKMSYQKLLCMTMLLLDSERGILRPSKRLREFGPYAVIITDFEQFFRRIYRAGQRELAWGMIASFGFRAVAYYDAAAHFTALGGLGVFDKQCSFRWQREWRLRIEESLPNRRPLSFPVGSLRDMAYLARTDALLDEV